MRRLLLSAAVAIALCAPAAARTLDFSDLRAIVGVADPQISPDGTRVIYIKSRSDFDKDRKISEVMLANVKTGAQRPLTFERRGLGMARWSPDGSRIAFLAPAGEGKDRHEQIYVMRMDGGDAMPVSRFDEDVQTYAWSPDGAHFAAIVRDKNPYQKQIENHLDAFEVGNNDYLHEAAAIPSHLWLVDARSGKSKRLTSGSFSLATVDPDGAADPSWSPRGDAVAFVRLPTPLVGDSLGGVVETVDVATGRIHKLTRNNGLEGSPLYSPASNAIAYTRSTNGDPTNGIAIYVAQGGTWRDIRASIDRNIDGAVWASDGKAMWLGGHDGTHDALWYVRLNGTPSRVSLPGFAISTLGNVAKNGTLALILNTSSHPSEVYVLSSPASAPKRITNWNQHISTLQLGRVT